MKLLLAFCMLLAMFFTAAAQDATGTPAEPAEPSTFLRALGLIADIPAVQDGAPIVSYGANHEALQARGLPVPVNWGLYAMLGEPAVVFASISGAGMSEMATSIRMAGPDYPAAVGFDFFQIEAAIEVGLPPTNGQLLLGAFDANAVIEAHVARGYTVESESEAGTLLCPADGCDSGMKTRFDGVDRSNPFGGQLGQMKPLFVGDGVIAVAGDFAVLQALIAPLTEDAPVLAERPEYQALAGALTAYPLVPAVMVFDPADLQLDTAPDEDAQAVIDANPLPPFELVAIASGADDDPRVEDGVLLLVYADAADAETAAASIDARMALASVRAQATYAELYSVNGTLEPAQVVTDEATGLSVVMVRVSSENPPLEDENGLTVLAHKEFLRFMQSLVARDALWLLTTGGE